MRKAIFMDIGGHEGQTVDVVLDSNWTFAHIYSFEPDPKYAIYRNRNFNKTSGDRKSVV